MLGVLARVGTWDEGRESSSDFRESNSDFRNPHQIFLIFFNILAINYISER